ncbi:MAG: redoxin domain-containing protein [Saprospiraceae bacterium]|nr:redoxin domain-containing protein [Saprospiraceae bacterium]
MRLAFLLFAIAFFFVACGNEPKAPQAQPEAAATNDQPKYSDAYLDNKKRKEQAESPDITVTIQGLSASGYAKLIGSFEGQNYLADSAQIGPNGTIVFKRKEPYFPGLLYLLLPGDMNLQMLIDLDQTFSMTTSLGNMAGDMKVNGSVENQLLYESLQYDEKQRVAMQAVATKMARFKPGTPEYPAAKAEQDKLVDDRRQYLEKLFKENPTTLFTSFKRAGQNPDLRDCYKPDGTMDTLRYGYNYRQRFWKGVDFNDERLLYTPVVSKMLERFITELTPQHPDSVVKYSIFLVDRVVDKPEFFKYFANWIVLKYDPKESTLMDPQAVYVNMIERYFTYERAVWSDSAEVFGLQQRAYEMSASLMGKKAANVQVPGMDGKPYALYDKKAPYVVVYMWNPDCEHCAEQTPKLVQLYNQMKDKGLDVYGIAVNTEDAKFRAAVKKYGMPWTNVFDVTNKSIYAKFYVDNTPEVYLLDPDRTIIAKNLQVDQIMTMVDRDKAKRGLK